jgi:hypothetical protein
LILILFSNPREIPLFGFLGVGRIPLSGFLGVRRKPLLGFLGFGKINHQSRKIPEKSQTILSKST